MRSRGSTDPWRGTKQPHCGARFPSELRWPQGNEEEAVMAVEPTFQHDGVPMGVPCGELAEGLVT